MPRPGKEAVLVLIPDDGDIRQAKLFNAASDKSIVTNRCRELLAELMEDGEVFKWQTPRPGTNNAISYSRHQQPERDQ